MGWKSRFLTFKSRRTVRLRFKSSTKPVMLAASTTSPQFPGFLQPDHHTRPRRFLRAAYRASAEPEIKAKIGKALVELARAEDLEAINEEHVRNGHDALGRARVHNKENINLLAANKTPAQVLEYSNGAMPEAKTT